MSAQRKRGEHEKRAIGCAAALVFIGAMMIGFYVMGPLVKQARAPSEPVSDGHGHHLSKFFLPSTAGRTPWPSLMAGANTGTRVRASPQMSLNGVLARRSVVKYDTSKEVPSDVVQRALEAAVLAPNHFLSEPWRFYLAGEETKKKLCGLNEDKRKVAEGVPGWLIVTLASEHEQGEKLWLEDHAAVACATQNFMTSLASEGVASKWMTGALGAAPEDVLAAVGAPDSEKLMGAIWYGYPEKELSESNKAPPRKKGLDGVLKKLA